MSSRAAMVERVEMRAEHDARSGKPPNPEDAIAEAVHRYSDEHGSLDLLHVRYWMYYAAGIADPEQAADVTLQFWRDLKEA